MSQRLLIENFLQEKEFRTLIDVRTPAEFEQGHIPGAKNLPLFTNDERAEIGTIYKQISPQKALLRGLDLVGGKMRGFVEQALKMAVSKKVAVYCWRGGKRSESMGWLLQMAGFNTVTLAGGYKAFRKLALESFDEKQLPLLVLGGRTGSGKTEILRALKKSGEQVVDLEAIANHKGSAFGDLGEAPQPTVEQFENLLFHEIQQLDTTRRIWIENESRHIGRVYLPDGFWAQKSTATLLHLEIPFEDRLVYLVKNYGEFPTEGLRASFQKIEKKLGGQRLKQALASLDENDLPTAARIGLEYYDKSYDHCITEGKFSEVLRLELPSNNPENAAKFILENVNFPPPI